VLLPVGTTASMPNGSCFAVRIRAYGDKHRYSGAIGGKAHVWLLFSHQGKIPVVHSLSPSDCALPLSRATPAFTPLPLRHPSSSPPPPGWPHPGG